MNFYTNVESIVVAGTEKFPTPSRIKFVHNNVNYITSVVQDKKRLPILINSISNFDGHLGQLKFALVTCGINLEVSTC